MKGNLGPQLGCLPCLCIVTTLLRLSIPSMTTCLHRRCHRAPAAHQLCDCIQQSQADPGGDVQEGRAFEEAAEAYIRAYLDRGAPSLFSTLKPLYR